VKRPKRHTAKASRKADRRAPRDGSSFERAILMDQWRWQARHYPGAELLLQKLSHHEGWYFDVLLLALTSGEVREVYFDVTDLFTAGREHLTRLRAQAQKRHRNNE
jgi:hypothetical protein